MDGLGMDPMAMGGVGGGGGWDMDRGGSEMAGSVGGGSVRSRDSDVKHPKGHIHSLRTYYRWVVTLLLIIQTVIIAIYFSWGFGPLQTKGGAADMFSIYPRKDDSGAWPPGPVFRVNPIQICVNNNNDVTAQDKKDKKHYYCETFIVSTIKAEEMTSKAQTLPTVQWGYRVAAIYTSADSQAASGPASEIVNKWLIRVFYQQRWFIIIFISLYIAAVMVVVLWFLLWSKKLQRTKYSYSEKKRAGGCCARFNRKKWYDHERLYWIILALPWFLMMLTWAAVSTINFLVGAGLVRDFQKNRQLWPYLTVTWNPGSALALPIMGWFFALISVIVVTMMALHMSIAAHKYTRVHNSHMRGGGGGGGWGGGEMAGGGGGWGGNEMSMGGMPGGGGGGVW